ncbi:hypothetical protein D3C78_1808010 [compost metagenome]
MAPFGPGAVDFYQVLARRGLVQPDERKGLTIIRLHGARFNRLSTVSPINRSGAW